MLRLPLPGRRAPVLAICLSVFLPSQSALFLPLVPAPQSEYGDLYRMTLDYEGETVRGAPAPKGAACLCTRPECLRGLHITRTCVWCGVAGCPRRLVGRPLHAGCAGQ